MNLINREILACMRELAEKSENGISAQFVFPETFTGFCGHFEGRPILPGICKIQAVRVMLSEHFKKSLRLTEVVSAKYIVPVLPGEKIAVECQLVETAGAEMKVQVLIKKETEKVAMLKLCLQAQGEVLC